MNIKSKHHTLRYMKYFSLTISVLLIILFTYFYLVSLNIQNIFSVHRDMMIFLLYTAPLLGMLLLIQLFEAFRHRILNKWQPIGFLVIFSLGGVLVPLFGLLIIPTNIQLFNWDNLILLAIGLGCGFGGALLNYLIVFLFPAARKAPQGQP